ncbi:MAG: hypothetical protein LBG80_02580 [Bacteroidales bacterium]|jgi:hypothetical protein|nr:hypothetical protein [Bacteroidales bacterium]
MKSVKSMTLRANKSAMKEADKGISQRGHKNLSFRFLLVTALISITMGGFFIACNSEDISEDTVTDMEIVNSVELEEYIIAASDFKQSLAVFEKELSKIDFSNLEISYSTDGKEIMRFPSSVASIGIEDKLQIFNEKKETLLEKYPQCISFSSEISRKYFQQCIKSSLNVNKKLLEFGINVSRPLLKDGTVETWYGEDWYFFISFLSVWMSSANYVELFIIAHIDGSYSTWVDSRNTANHAHLEYERDTITNVCTWAHFNLSLHHNRRVRHCECSFRSATKSGMTLVINHICDQVRKT